MFPNREICTFVRKMEPHFDVEFLPEAVAFLEKLDDKARAKIYFNIRKAQFVNDKVLFKKLNDYIWEFRTLFRNKAYRLFAFWDKRENQDALVIATHGILKKKQKTPSKEIKKAEEMRKQYLNQKYTKNNKYEK